MRFVCIVEGHGEVEALPILLRRLDAAIVVPRSLRVSRGRLTKPGEAARYVEVAARFCEPADAILLLLDADDACARDLAQSLRATAAAARPDRKVAVVVAVREFEAWFVAAAESLAGRRGLADDVVAPDRPESIRDAKGWLGQRMRSGYSPTIDQPPFAAAFDLELARRRAPSFDKLGRDIAGLKTRG